MSTHHPQKLSRAGIGILAVLVLTNISLAQPVHTQIMLSEQDVKADVTLLLTDETYSLNISRGLKIHEQAPANSSVSDIISDLNSGAFHGIQGNALNEGFGTNPVFAYVVVENRSNTSQWFLHLNYALLDRIDGYVVNELGSEKRPMTYLGQDGDTLPFSQRLVKIPGFVFPVSLEPGQKALLLLKVQTEGARYAEITLHTAIGLASKESSTGFGLGLYFGGMLVFAIYTLLLFFLMRSSGYLIFFGLVGMMTLFFLAEAGLIAQYVSTSDPIWANLLFMMALSGIAFMGFWLNLVFLRKAITMNEQRLLKWLMGCAGLNFLLSFGVQYTTVSKIGLALIVVFMVTTGWMSVRAWLSGYPPAKKYSYAIFLMIVGGSIESLKVMGYIPINDLSRIGPSAGVAAFIFLMSVALIERVILEQERSKALFRSFEKFAPASLVRALHQNGEVVGIGGSRKHVSILFSDIKGYSSVVESTAPKVVVQLMTEYFDNMQRSIEQHGGYILEFAGDGILAVFGAPSPLSNHPEQATKCAIEMQQIVTQLNRRYSESGRLDVFQNVGLDGLAIRIGVHTGTVIAGTLGSRQTLKYGIIGDSVNIAARLEALNKEVGSTLLISESTFEDMSADLKGHFEGLGAYPVKGRQEPVNIFRLCEEHNDASSPVPLELESINTFDWWD